MTTFDDAVVAGVIGHMNGDHGTDNLSIVQAFAEPTATAAWMVGLDSVAGDWVADVDGVEKAVKIPWPEPALDRPSIRVQVVALCMEAYDKLGVERSEH
ncbi:DUF2470 domain-containing protein [Rhodococcus sp. IEGM 1379]|uniref:DUF2470 domain-containing protein n=1 Tax=Rhodococcus sp. IEGM 1379 TaxID=3047086 RepID=UPI0024B65F85|nr:DUF2470 domain-containing protein [Rhodococcus sp. IEGM 1379]MDI9917433.1 DUF2470 domain-containing protein [Rhodococcus sp. IEGM 1379]